MIHTVPPESLQRQSALIYFTYWTYNAAERLALLSRFPDGLSWSERLRFLQLLCMERLMGAKAEESLRLAGLQTDAYAGMGSAKALYVSVTKELLSETSPYRSRACSIELGTPAAPGQSVSPGRNDTVRNASATHLGSMETIRLDANERPLQVAFEAFADLREITFGPPGIFRWARIVRQKGDAEMVLAPLMYGISWLTGKIMDRDPQMTRFYRQGEIEGLMGIGVGQQDLEYRTGMGGLGGVHRIMFEPQQ